MLDAVAPPGAEEVAIVGAVNNAEEAAQASQMAFILAWAMRFKTVARSPHGAGPKTSRPPK